MDRYRLLPPLQYLTGFEAAARLGNFSAAASELGLTQSAVSHQIRLLEDRIGQKLFLRIGRIVALTDAGRDYQRSVTHALELLAKGHKRLAPYANPQSVVIYAPRDFTARWLMPRLADMLAACPGVEPWIDTSGKLVDFRETEASIAIVLTGAAPEDAPAVSLCRESLTPLMVPALAQIWAESGNGAAVARIHCEGGPGWDEWLEASGAARPAALVLGDQDLALAAAEAGLGAALASPALAASSIKAGRLAAPSALMLDTGRSWHAVSNETELAHKATAQVWAWLTRQAGQD